MQQHYKLLLPGMILALAILASPFASAQSSGNFTANITTTQCTINTTPNLPNSGGAGPGSITVTQTKAFSQSSGVTVGP